MPAFFAEPAQVGTRGLHVEVELCQICLAGLAHFVNDWIIGHGSTSIRFGGVQIVGGSWPASRRDARNVLEGCALNFRGDDGACFHPAFLAGSVHPLGRRGGRETYWRPLVAWRRW